MKTIPWVSLVVALAGGSFGGSCLGQVPEVTKSEEKPREGLRQLDTLKTTPASQAGNLGPVERSSKLIGAAVKDASGEKVGKIRDLAIDLYGGRVLQVIVTQGGILGVGGKSVALPPTTMSLDGSGDVTTSVDHQKVEGAPAFALEKWEESTGPDQVSEMYRYYEVEPRLVPRYSKDAAGDLAKSEATGAQLVPVIVQATKLMGLPVTHDSGKEVGKISDLGIDLSSARVPVVVVSTGGFLGVGDELNAIPSSLFRYESERGQVVLLTVQENLKAAPRFKANEWSDYATSERIREVYRAYGLKPYFDGGPAPDNTRLNVRDRIPGTVNPADQGDSESDLKTTADIRRAVTQDEGLSINAQNVKIITIHGRVTLRGPVKSVTEKERIEALAKSVAGVDKVHSQLEVAPQDSEK